MMMMMMMMTYYLVYSSQLSGLGVPETELTSINSAWPGRELRTFCVIAQCANHYATGATSNYLNCTVFVYCTLCWKRLRCEEKQVLELSADVKKFPTFHWF